MTDERPADKQWRLFVAIELPEAWQQALASLQDEMRAALERDSVTREARVRWVKPEGIHLTLKFLGEVDASRVPAIEQALLSAVTKPPGLTLRLGHAGSFNDRRAPRIIWAGIEGDVPALQALATRIDTWLTSAGFPRERRGLIPHLTLARLPGQLPQPLRERIAAVTNQTPPKALPAFEVESISLMRSFLGRGGARYECIFRAPHSPLQNEGHRL